MCKKLTDLIGRVYCVNDANEMTMNDNFGELMCNLKFILYIN